MWRALARGSRPDLESGTEVTRPSEPPVTVTRAEAPMNAYTKLVAAPSPSRLANGRQTT